MREIEFRGKTDGNWCYGSLVNSPSEDQYYIAEHLGDELQYPVEEETIGQFTGRTDKNGTKIFEDDIVKKNFNGRELKGIVEYKDCAFGVRINDDDSGLFLCFFNDCEVIGNIHDNPELLEAING